MNQNTQIMNMAVLGSGQMGSGIAQVSAQSGKNVIIYDNFKGALEKSKKTIEASLQKLASKNLLKEDWLIVLNRIQFCDDITQIKNVQIVVEAVTENFEVKTSLFKALDQQLSADVIFASNTSSISISTLAAQTKRPSKFIGMHFMNPVPLMKLVEVIPCSSTSPETLSCVRALAVEMGKVVVQSADRAGFIVNRILMPMINEACFALQEKLATAEDIDEAMKLGTNQPMGPLALADYIGLDTCLFIMNVIHEGLKEDKYKAAPLLKQYVESGYLGKKSGRGFYIYGASK